ncbi:MAG: aminotransferase class I/II-fold pyridoxal phosphate-dependent enzyme [Gammaproteobacteria bacterium]|nr:aminotransferase class I/II-fold pyridoxal phosphate-dependent enzyme [Gammaproteobacteria bacterium]
MTESRHIETLGVHAGRDIEGNGLAVTPAISPSTTFLRGEDGNYPGGHQYSRGSNPTRARLETALAALDGANDAIAFASGMAAIAAVFQLLKPGDHAIVSSDSYHGTRRYVSEWTEPRGIGIDFVDTADTDAVRSAMRKETRLLWIESPSNPLLTISDFDALAELARQNDCLTACDATLATPVLQHTLDHGIDMAVHSSTKYLGGHSDLLGGVVTTRDSALAERLHQYQVEAGAVPSAFDAWLLLRSLATLSVRIRQQSETAMQLATWLEADERIEAVHYPMLESHRHHGRAMKYLAGGGGVLSLQLRGKEAQARRMANATKVFTQATSLGGVESLIEHRASIEGAQRRSPDNLLRLSIGLEHVEDLKNDLAAAMDAATAGRQST